MIANPIQQIDERSLLTRVAEKYKRDGYEVIVEPGQRDMPFDLGTYRPDLLVKKPNGKGYVIEIKKSAAQTAIGRYREVAEIVADNAGWRFLLVTGDEGEAEKENRLLSWVEIAQRKERSDHLLAIGEYEAAFLSLWALAEASLRKRAEETLIPIERFPVMSLIKQLYSQGELSITQLDKLSSLFPVRNHVVHGYQTENLETIAIDFQALVEELLHSWLPTTQNGATA